MRTEIRPANLLPVVVAALLAAATIPAAGWLPDGVADLSRAQQTSLGVWLLLPSTALAALTLFIRRRKRRRARSD